MITEQTSASAAAGGLGPHYRVRLTAVCLLAFAAYFVTSVRLPVVPLFAVELGASTTEVGLINSSFLLMMGLLALPLGLLGDRWGRRSIVVSGLSLAAVASLLLYWSHSPGQLMSILLVFGVGLAMIGPSLMAQVADISPPSHLGRAYGWYTLAIYTGMSIGPAVGGALAEIWGYRWIFLALAMATLALLPPALVSLRSPAAADQQGQVQALTLLWEEGGRNRALQGCWLLTLGSCFALGFFVTFFPLYAKQQGLTAREIGLVFALQALVNALSRLPLGRLSDRLDKGSLTLLGFLGLSLVLMGFGFSRSLAAFLGLAFLSGAVQGLGFTPLGALISEVAAPAARGLAMGGYNAAIYLGMMAGSASMGPVVDRAGFAVSFWLAALVNLGAALGFYLIRRQQRARSGRIPEILGICESCGAVVIVGYHQATTSGYLCRRCAVKQAQATAETSISGADRG